MPFIMLIIICMCTLIDMIVKKATSCTQLGHPAVQATTGPGVQAEVSLSVDPRSPWGSCTVEFH